MFLQTGCGLKNFYAISKFQIFLDLTAVAGTVRLTCYTIIAQIYIKLQKCIFITWWYLFFEILVGQIKEIFELLAEKFHFCKKHVF